MGGAKTKRAITVYAPSRSPLHCVVCASHEMERERERDDYPPQRREYEYRERDDYRRDEPPPPRGGYDDRGGGGKGGGGYDDRYDDRRYDDRRGELHDTSERSAAL